MPNTVVIRNARIVYTSAVRQTSTVIRTYSTLMIRVVTNEVKLKSNSAVRKPRESALFRGDARARRPARRALGACSRRRVGPRRLSRALPRSTRPAGAAPRRRSRRAGLALAGPSACPAREP